MEQVRAIAAAGYKATLCNRPDGEAGDQPRFSEIDLAAQAEGIPARYLPVVPGQLSDEQAKEFGRVLDELPRPVLAEFTYGGKLAPGFLTWLLKERVLPPLYWMGMLKGHEWLAEPEPVG